MFTFKNYNSVFWRYFANFWSVVLFGFFIADFVSIGGYEYFLGPLSAIYVAVLGIFSTQKEFERWHSYYDGRHPGEMYVYAWTLLMVSVFLLDAIYQMHYQIPQEIIATYIVVLGILAITKKSKEICVETNSKIT
jgi:uncharacterized membrane protein